MNKYALTLLTFCVAMVPHVQSQETSLTGIDARHKGQSFPLDAPTNKSLERE